MPLPEPLKAKEGGSNVTVSLLKLQIKLCYGFPAVRGALKIKIFQFSEGKKRMACFKLAFNCC